MEPGIPPELLDDLRNGERGAFVRFYELYRLPVYNLVLRLVGGGVNAAAVTREVFIRAYRQLLVPDGTIDVRPLVYGVAVDTCLERDADPSNRRPVRSAGNDRAAEVAGWADGPLARRFEQSLRTLDGPQRAALLLNDVHGLSRAETAVALGLSAEATAALLFRAGEGFRRAFEEVSAGRTDWACRLAETAVAGSVGRGNLAADEARKLRQHVRYCRHCRAIADAWASGPIGLSLFVSDAPLPRSLETVPVFGIASPSADDAWAAPKGQPAGGGRSAAVVAVLAAAGRALTSKAAAYALAAVCSAAFLGLALYVSQHEWAIERQPLVPRRSVAAANRHTPRTSVVPTLPNTPASGASGGASRPAGETYSYAGYEVAQAVDAHDLGAPALAVLSPSTQAGPRAAPGVAAAPGGSAAADGVVRGHRKSDKHDHARAGAASRRGGPGTAGLRKGDVRRGKADKTSPEAKQRPHLHHLKNGNWQRT